MVDLNYLRAKLESVHGGNSEVTEHTVTPDGTVKYTLMQPVPVNKLPSFAKSLVPAGERISRREVWSSSQQEPVMTSSSAVPNTPAKIEAVARLLPDGENSVLVTELTVNVSVPLFGGKIEKVLIESLGELLEKEHRFTAQWLETHAAGGR